MSEIRYEWTGEYRSTKTNDWIMHPNDLSPQQIEHDGQYGCQWILRRIESESAGEEE